MKVYHKNNKQRLLNNLKNIEAIQNDNSFNNYFQNLIDNNLIDKYELNKKLVDLTEIPENLIINFNNKYNIINK